MPGTIYFIEAGDGGPVKIGFTKCDVKQRMAGLQTSSPYPLKLLWSFPGTLRREQKLHKQCKKYHLHGEWFEPANQMVDELVNIDELCCLED